MRHCRAIGFGTPARDSINVLVAAAFRLYSLALVITRQLMNLQKAGRFSMRPFTVTQNASMRSFRRELKLTGAMGKGGPPYIGPRVGEISRTRHPAFGFCSRMVQMGT
jgi:hypothetical protein